MQRNAPSLRASGASRAAARPCARVAARRSSSIVVAASSAAPPTRGGSGSATSSSSGSSIDSPAAAGRRRALLSMGALLVSSGVAGAQQAASARDRPVTNKEVATEDSPFIQELLRRTEEKRDERKAQRLRDYYKKNFRDYFEFDGGSESAARARGLSPETAAAYRKWLDENADEPRRGGGGGGGRE